LDGSDVERWVAQIEQLTSKPRGQPIEDEKMAKRLSKSDSERVKSRKSEKKLEKV
jgi:hypothetical protein